jgi:hypothetical protein
VGAAASLAVLVVVIARMDWKAEVDKARVRAWVSAPLVMMSTAPARRRRRSGMPARFADE